MQWNMNLGGGRYVDSVDKLYILEVEVEVEVGAVYVWKDTRMWKLVLHPHIAPWDSPE